MRASDFLTEFLDTNGDSGREDPESFPLTEFADIIEQYLGRGYTRKDGERPEQVSVKFEPKDKTRNGAILYSVVGKRGEYPTVNVHLLDYEQGFGRSRKAGVAIPKTRDNALKLAELIFNAQLNEFLDDRKRDDDDEISKIVSTTDRLLKQGYKVDLHIVGAMGRVFRADFDQVGFAPNGALAFKRKTRAFIRPFLIDDDDKYDFEMVAPKHYKIVDSFTRTDNLTESTFREHEEQLRDFIQWCVKKLKIKQELPQIRFQDAKEGPDQHRTGYYDDAQDVMWIYTGNRNMIDIMRTVAHELTHRKQHEDNMVHGDQSYPGSPIEQEADAVAGYLMKLYGKIHPEIIE
jgi:hypothetical protein